MDTYKPCISGHARLGRDFMVDNHVDGGICCAQTLHFRPSAPNFGLSSQLLVRGGELVERSKETLKGVMTATQMRTNLVERATSDEAFRARLLADSRAAIQEEYGITVPPNMNVVVHEEDGQTAHVVLPRSKRLTEAELQAAAGGGQHGMYW